MRNPTSSITRKPAGALLASLAFLTTLGAHGGALENYINAPDPHFNWKRTEQKKIGGASLTHLELVSQHWRGQFWSHHVMVYRPAELRNPHIALLVVSGGGYNAPNDRDVEFFKITADRAGAVLAMVNKIPNQPLHDGRKEDSLIAYTFDQYMKTGDETWPLLFPMAKSAVRAMDTVQQFVEKEFSQKIESFVVTGASKRGWTTWLTGAADKRVVAIAPMVIDMLNMKAQLDWADKMYGKQSEEIADYTQLNLHLRMDEPIVKKLREFVDPYSYRERYTMPKLLLLGTNDPYWVVDALRHYWDDLPGPKILFQTPNAGHDLGGGKDAIVTLATFFQMVADKQPMPKVEWKFGTANGAATIRVKADQPAKVARLWTAESQDRDFRDDKWSSRELEVKSGNQASATIETPATGYRAYMAEVVVTSPAGHEYKLSTEARVTPDGKR